MTLTQQTPLINAATVATSLKTQFPASVNEDKREGYSGIVVSPDQLVQVAQTLRDTYGYDYLSNAAAVDYLGVSDHLEMVYHLFRTSGGPAFVLKAQTSRENPSLPSLIQVYPGADFQEREAYDLYGIRFAGHPNLRRILMWEGFAGHPMRKDWKEPYYEEDHKPFESRWPNGYVFRAEERNIYGSNVQYPDDFDLVRLNDQSEDAVYESLGLGVDVQQLRDDGSGLKTDRLVVNLGPQHPSTHGVFRMAVIVDGETVEQLEPVMGYLHRNHEKIGERNTWLHNIPFTDRLDYLSAMGNNHGYVQTVEKLLSLNARFQKPSYRAEVLRVLMVELNRIASHMWSIGFLLNDLGTFFTPALYAIAERERILDFFEAVSGARIMYNYMRFSGVFKDLPERIRSVTNLVNDRVRDWNTMDYLTELITERLPRAVDELQVFIEDSEIVKMRTMGVGYLPPELAIACSTSGPLLRGSGVAYDIRRSDPYSIYPELDFDVAVRTSGDIYARSQVRIQEMQESLRILRQLLPRLEMTRGESVTGGSLHTPRVPAGEAYGHVENPRGELGFYVVSAGDPKGNQNPWRYHVRGPSFVNLTALSSMCRGHKVADVVAVLGSIDIVLGETDR